MARYVLAAALALATTACLPMPPPAPHVKRANAVGQIDPGERDKAFGRALAYVQGAGWMIAVSDRAAGLLTTQSMNTGAKPCGALQCDSRSTLQITITETGAVIVNLHRELYLNTGYPASSRWFVPTYEPDVLPIQEEQAQVLAAISGTAPGVVPAVRQP